MSDKIGKFELSVSGECQTKRNELTWHLELDGKEVFQPSNDYEFKMFKAELTARLKMIAEVYQDNL